MTHRAAKLLLRVGTFVMVVLVLGNCASAPIPAALLCPAFKRPPMRLDAMPSAGSCLASPGVESWVRSLRRSVMHKWHPPKDAWKGGEVQAVFVLARDGSVRDSCIMSAPAEEDARAVLEALDAHRFERRPPPEVTCLLGIRLLGTFKVKRQ